MHTTFVEAFEALPRGGARGFRFVSSSWTERFYSYEEMNHEARRRASGLRELGLGKGDRLGLIVADPEHFVLSFLGAVLAGVVPVPIASSLSFGFKSAKSYIETTRHILRVSGARALLIEPEARSSLVELAVGEGAVGRILDTKELCATPAPGFTPPLITPDDLCFLQYTSGSTSLPKGVMVTHRSLVANAHVDFGPSGLARGPDDVHLGWLPLYHDMGLIGFVLGPLTCDLPTVLFPTTAFARRPTMWMAAMHKFRATMSFAPNFAYELAARRASDADLAELDLRHVRVLGCGAEPINANVLRAFADRFAPAGLRREALLPAYGMAEGTLAITFHSLGAPMVTDVVESESLSRGVAVPAERGRSASVELVSCGRPFPGHELRVVDSEGLELPERRVGEIITRGPSVTAGYFGDPASTAETFRDGWLFTGDLGYIAGGNLYICGRIKDLIILKGINYYPQDIERAVGQVPGVRSHSTIAFSVLRGGDEILVVCAEGSSSDAPAIREAIAAAVLEATGLRVGHVAVVRKGSLPLTSSGKVQRRKTKQLFELGELEEHPRS